MKDNNQESNCCYECFDKIESLWDEHKYQISGKFSIGLSVLAGIASLISVKFIIPAGIILGVTNVGVFFAGLSLEKFSNENKTLKDNNESLKNGNESLRNEKNEILRRYTAFGTPTNTDLSNASTETHYEKMVNFSDLLNQNLRRTEPTQAFTS